MEKFGFTGSNAPKDAVEMANSTDPDQTAPNKEQSDMGLYCLIGPIGPNT